MSRTVLLCIAFLFLAAGVLTIVTAASFRQREADSSVLKTEHQKVEAPQDWMTEYTLTERSGRQFHSQELEGQVHVANFFFAGSTGVAACRQRSSEYLF